MRELFPLFQTAPQSGAAALQLQEEDRGRAAGPEELDRAFRRDARRYDGGSFLY